MFEMAQQQKFSLSYRILKKFIFPPQKRDGNNDKPVAPMLSQ